MEAEAKNYRGTPVLIKQGNHSCRGLSGVLRQLGLERVGRIAVQAPFPVFEIDKEARQRVGSVYVWAIADQEGIKEVLYVGKAGRQFISRCKQHQGGFRYSNTGKHNLARILVEHEAGNSIEVYARQSPTAEVLGEMVSMCGVEEDALIKKLQPTLNGYKGAFRTKQQGA